MALDAIKASGKPAVMTLAMHQGAGCAMAWALVEACKRLEHAGADVVGLNCIRGAATMLPVLPQIRAAVAGHVAALPVPYRTTPTRRPSSRCAIPAAPASRGPAVPGRARAVHLQPLRDRRVRPDRLALGIRYLGVCCGAGPHHIRAMAEALGRQPPASRYSPDMTRHSFFGTDAKLKAKNQEYATRL